MGEYSTACVCNVPGATAHAGQPAAIATGAGVMTQMRDAQRQYCDMEDCGRFGD